MSMKFADTARPNNSTEEAKGTFPVAMAYDVWCSDGDSVEEKLNASGSSIQKETLPTPTAALVDVIYQYVGFDTAEYTNGLFYQCQPIDDGQGGTTYGWVEKEVQNGVKVSQETGNTIETKNDGIYVAPTQVTELPTASEDELGKIYQYIGSTTTTYTKGSFYECIGEGNPITYSWHELGGGVTIKDVDGLPTSSIENIIYRLTSTFNLVFNQTPDQMILATKGFTYTEDTVDGIFIREWTTNVEAYVRLDSQYKRVNKIIYKYSTELHCYHKIMYNDEVLHEGIEDGIFIRFYFKVGPTYYAGDTINQETERMAKYSDVPKEFIGTQAEWDALTTDEKLEYTIANITDDDSGANLDYYSATETKTNKVWIDGKPIYRKVFNNLSVTLVTSQWIDIIDLPTNFDEMIDCDIFHLDSSNKFCKLPILVAITQDTGKLQCYNVSGVNYGGTIKRVIIEYTKTTD